MSGNLYPPQPLAVGVFYFICVEILDFSLTFFERNSAAVDPLVNKFISYAIPLAVFPCFANLALFFIIQKRSIKDKQPFILKVGLEMKNNSDD